MAESYIIKQGTPFSSGFLIMEGEVQLTIENSTLSTVIQSQHPEAHILVDNSLQTKRGYISRTIANFQIGKLSVGEWIGDDFLFLDKDAHYYSVIAVTPVKCLKLDKKEYSSMSSILKDILKKKVIERGEWMADRIKTLTSSVGKVMTLEQSNIDYNENLQENIKKYPQASSDVMTSIRKRGMMKLQFQDVSRFLSAPRMRPERPERAFIMERTDIEKAIYQCKANFIRSKHLRSGMFRPVTQNVADSINTLNETKRFKDLFGLGESNLADESLGRNNCYTSIGRIPLSFASHTRALNTLIPTSSRQARKPYQCYTDRGNYTSDRNFQNELESDFLSKNLNAFSIGKKAIKVLENRNAKPSTPNPFLTRKL